MIYLKVQENEYPAYISGRLIDRDWDGRASKSITLTVKAEGRTPWTQRLSSLRSSVPCSARPR